MDHALVALDGSEQAWRAFEFALEEFAPDRMTVLYVIDPATAGYSAQASIPSYSEEWYEQATERAEDIFEEARERAGGRVDLETATEVGRPSRVIVEYVQEDDVDHVVTGSHGRSGVSRILLGSVAETVVRRSSVPVTVVR